MQIYEYPSYADYRRAQYRANKAKLTHVWVRRSNIERIIARLAELGVTARFGLCHGSRNGWEQSFFAELLAGCEVLGTEIAPTAEQFPRTVRWDFHKAKAEWIRAVDFIYSNSLDHARDPLTALAAWLQCLRGAGVLIIEWGSEHEKSNESDPFGATVAEVCEMIRRCGGEIALVEDAPERPERVTYLKLIYARRVG